jgi:hypothetical protein
LSALQAALVPTTEKASTRSWLMDEGAIVSNLGKIFQ